MPEEGSKKDSLTIRRMTEEDVASAAMIDRLSFSLPWSEYAFRHEVTGNENARAWVAEVQTGTGQKEVIGVTVVWLVLDEAHIGTIAIHPDHRRKGVGRQLMKHALIEAANEGASLVYLEVRRSNLPAIHMYQEMGFETVGVRKKYYQDNGEDALLMTLPDLKLMVSNIQ
jgi:ribosomal-protein-alanine N-acetyltransferase